MDVDAIHRLLWSRAGDRLRVHVDIGELAGQFGVYYSLMNDAVNRMKSQGRIRFIECKPGKRYIYEVANPNTYDHTNIASHAQKARKPMWG